MKENSTRKINDLVNYKNIKIIQDKNYFNFSLDSVLLPNFVTLNPNTKMILDLCSGNLPIPLILSTKTNANIYAVELQQEIYDLAKETLKIALEKELEKQCKSTRVVIANSSLKFTL